MHVHKHTKTDNERAFLFLFIEKGDKQDPSGHNKAHDPRSCFRGILFPASVGCLQDTGSSS